MERLGSKRTNVTDRLSFRGNSSRGFYYSCFINIIDLLITILDDVVQLVNIFK